jgi:hypothetical protein
VGINPNRRLGSDGRPTSGPGEFGWTRDRVSVIPKEEISHIVGEGQRLAGAWDQEGPVSEMYVKALAVNFRSRPIVSEETLLGTVFLGQRLTNVEESDTEGWVSCTAELESGVRDGFVSRRFLRAPLPPGREALVASVHREWMRFKRGLGKEHIRPFSDFVGEMWAALGNDLDGTDRGVPWSAAAMSFMVRNAGRAYAGFRFATAHSKYIHHAIRARLDNNRSVPFWGYRLDEIRPQIGDIVCRDNPDFAPNMDFDIASNTDSYRSHCDVIMQIDSANQRLIAIGGNVRNSVHHAFYDLAPGDFLDDTQHTFALLRNITD